MRNSMILRLCHGQPCRWLPVRTWMRRTNNPKSTRADLRQFENQSAHTRAANSKAARGTLHCFTAIPFLLSWVFAATNAWSADLDPAALFEKPVALIDAAGKPLITGLANGCPFAADFNGDGKIDIVLGAHEGMDTGYGGIWLIPNTGTNEKPAFSMASAIRVATAEGPLKIGCG